MFEIVELLVIVVLIGCNGVFAMSELAMVSSRRSLLEQRAARGDKGAEVALEMMANPGDFLATIQVGITLIGVIAGAFGGATLSEHLALWLNQFPIVAPYSAGLALAIVVACITYLSLIIGELVPKEFALRNPEAIASNVARPIRFVSTVAKPAVRAISGSSRLVMWILRVPRAPESNVTEEEIRYLIKQGARTGVIEALEHEMVERVLRLDDRRVTAVMTPRLDVDWIDVNDSLDDILVKFRATSLPEMPVGEGSIDKIAGMLRVHDLLLPARDPGPFDIRSLLKVPFYVPYTATGLEVLEKLRETSQNIAVIVDEFGGLEGTVTLDDLTEAVLGLTVHSYSAADLPKQREDGSWLLDGSVDIDRLKELTGIESLPEEESHAYETVAGFALNQFNRIPSEGDSFECEGWRFEVMDMDGQRIDKLLIAAMPDAGAAEQEA